MKFIFTYDDIKLWSRNFLGIEIGISAHAKKGGMMSIETPANVISRIHSMMTKNTISPFIK